MAAGEQTQILETLLNTKPSFGNINPYNSSEPFENFLERVEAFFAVNHRSASDTEKVSSLILLISPEMYAVLKNIFLPDTVINQTFATVVNKLKEYYCPKRLVISERYKFNTRKQMEGESVGEFIVALSRLASNCQFDYFLDQALRDRLVAGLSDAIMVRKLLSETNPISFDEACKIVLDMDTVRRNTAVPNEHGESESFAIRKNFNRRWPTKSQSLKEYPVFSDGLANTNPKKFVGQDASANVEKMCGRCGKKSHSESVCPAKEWVCFLCEKKGHTSRCCRTKI